MEVAALGLKVDGVQDVVKAGDALDDFAKSAQKADKANDGLSKSSKKTAQGAEDQRAAYEQMRASVDNVYAATDKLNKNSKALDSMLRQGTITTKEHTETMALLQQQYEKSTSKVSELANMVKRAGVAIGAAFSINALKNYADGWSDMQSKVGAATGDMAGAADMMTRLVDIANASYAPLQQTAQVFSQNVSTFKDLGKSAAEAADFTEAVNHALVTTATRGQDADVVINSLSRSLATGKLDAQAFDTIVSRSPRVLQAMADKLGVTTSELRGLAVQGKVTSDVIASGLTGSLAQLAKEAGEMPATLSDAFTRINNNLTEFVGRIDKATGASSAIADVVLGFADGIRSAGTVLINFGSVVSNALQPLSGFFGYLADQTDTLLAALAGFAAPAIAAGIWGVSTALISGMAAALKIVWALMLANPVGVFIAALAALGVAAYKMRDTIQEVFGVDIVQAARDAANFVIRGFASAFENIKFVWNNFGSMMGNAVIGGVNAAITAINGLISGAIEGVNTLIESLNKIPGLSIGLIDTGPAIELMANTYAENMTAALAERNKAINAIMETDYIEGMINFGKSLTEVKTGADAAAGGVNKLTNETTKLTATQKAADSAFKQWTTTIAEKTQTLREELNGISRLSDSQKLLIKLEAELASGKSKLTAASVDKIKADLKELAGLEKLRKETERSVQAYLAQVEQQKEINAAYVNLSKAKEDLQKWTYQENASLKQSGELLQAESKLIGATDKQRKIAVATMQSELLLRQQIADIDSNREVDEGAREEARAQARLRHAERVLQAETSIYISEWDKTSQTIGQTLQDYIMGGGKDAAQYLKRLFSTLILEPIVNYGVQGVMGALGMGPAGGSAGGGMPSIGNMQSMWSMGSSAYSMWSGGMSAANVAGTTYANVTGTGLDGLLASNGAYGTAAGNGLSSVMSYAPYIAALWQIGQGNYGSGAGMAAGAYAGSVFGPIGTAIGAVIGGLVGSFADFTATPHMGARGYYNNVGGVDTSDNVADGKTKYNEQIGQSVEDLATAVGTSFSDFLGVFGMGATVRTEAAWADDFNGKGNSWGDLVIAMQDATGEWVDLVNWGAEGVGRFGEARHFKEGDEGFTEYMQAVMQGYVEALTKVDLPSWAGDMLESLGDDASMEQINQTLAALGVMRETFTYWNESLSEFANVGDAAFGALLESMGGFENLAAGVSSFVDLYYSEQEKLEMQTNQLTAALAKVNKELPASKEAWRAMVQEALDAGEEGAELAAVLLNLGPAFAAVTDSAAALAQAQIDEQKRVTDALYSEAGISGATIAQILRDGLLNRLTVDDVGAQMSIHIIDGIYNSLAGGFAQQITQLFTDGVITPLLQAAATGSSMAGVVSQASMDAVISQARASVAALAAIMNDPVFQQAMKDLQTTIADLNIGAPSRPVIAPARTQSSGGYSSTVKSQAKDMVNAWKSVYDAILGSMKSLRDTILGTTEDSGAGFYESQFAMLTAQARAGDQKAAEQLPALVDKLAAYAKENSASLYDQNAALAGYLASLEETNRYVAGLYQKSGGKVADLESLTTPVTYAAAGTKATPGSVVSAINMTGMGSTFNDNAAMMAEWRAIRDQLQLIRESNEDIATSARGIDRNVSDVTNQGEYVNVNVIEVETTA